MSKKYDNYQKPKEEVLIEQKLLPLGLPNRSGEKQIPKYIVIHETSLRLGRSPKEYNLDYYANKILTDGENGRTVGYHYLVGDKKIYQFVKDDEVTEHTGTYEGNHSSIGIERIICKDINFDEALFNQAKLIASLMIKWNIDLDHVVTHKQMQMLFEPKYKSYDLVYSGEVKEDISFNYHEQYRENMRLVLEILQSKSPVLEKIENQKILTTWQSKLTEIFQLAQNFSVLTKKRQLAELYILVDYKRKFNKMLCDIKNEEYKMLNIEIAGISFYEKLNPKPCPNRLIAGQRGGLSKFYREIQNCLEHQIFFEEVFNEESDLKLN